MTTKKPPSKAKDGEDDDYDDLPFLCRIWEKLHLAFQQRIRIGSTLSFRLDGITAFCLFFWALNLSVHQFLISPSLWMNWPNDDGLEVNRAVGFVVGFVHTATIIPPLLQWWHWNRYEINAWAVYKTTPERHAVTCLIQFSIAYFVYDTVYNYGYVRLWIHDGALTTSEWLFVAHHVICFFQENMAIQSPPPAVGHQFVAVFIICAECSNPLDNLVAFAQKGLELSPGPVLQFMHSEGQVALSVIYIFCRMIWIPTCCVIFSIQFWQQRRDDTPRRRFMAIYRFVAMWGITLASVPWILHCMQVLKQRFLLFDDNHADTMESNTADVNEQPQEL